jgi:hypothetical protein
MVEWWDRWRNNGAIKTRRLPWLLRHPTSRRAVPLLACFIEADIEALGVIGPLVDFPHVFPLGNELRGHLGN